MNFTHSLLNVRSFMFDHKVLMSKKCLSVFRVLGDKQGGKGPFLLLKEYRKLGLKNSRPFDLKAVV